MKKLKKLWDGIVNVCTTAYVIIFMVVAGLMLTALAIWVGIPMWITKHPSGKLVADAIGKAWVFVGLMCKYAVVRTDESEAELDAFIQELEDYMISNMD